MRCQDDRRRRHDVTRAFTRFSFHWIKQNFLSFFPSFLPFLILESSRSTCCCCRRPFYSFPFSIKDRFKAEFEITSLARSRTRNRHNERTNDSQKSHTYGNNNKRMGKRKDIHTRTGTRTTHTDQEIATSAVLPFLS